MGSLAFFFNHLIDLYAFFIYMLNYTFPCFLYEVFSPLSKMSYRPKYKVGNFSTTLISVFPYIAKMTSIVKGQMFINCSLLSSIFRKYVRIFFALKYLSSLESSFHAPSIPCPLFHRLKGSIYIRTTVNHV